MVAGKTLKKAALALALVGTLGTANASLTLDSWTEDLLHLSASWTVTMDGGPSFSTSMDGVYWDVTGLSFSYIPDTNNWLSDITAQHAHVTHEGEFGPVFSPGSIASGLPSPFFGTFNSTSSFSAMAPHALQAGWTTPANWTNPHWDHFEFTVASNTDGSATISLTALHPVPEPETYAMMIAGLGLVGFIARRRKGRPG